MSKRVMILGGDGFCGWPTALHLSARGYWVAIVDSQIRRSIDADLGIQSLTPIADIDTRISTWRSQTGLPISFARLDIRDDGLRRVLGEFRPNVVVHFAEQKSAPYSMRDHARRTYTVSNNILGTNNLLAALVDMDLDAHVVHLGTMGVYGYSTSAAPLPEGYIRADLGGGDVREILYPSAPGSIYHLTKVLDQSMFAFYARNDGLRITDLHQGIVWGTQTPETSLHPALVNRFEYDADFGSVLNRFLMQGALGIPLTVHGIGGQTRAFININDTVRCIELSIENPPARGERVKIMNQMTETHRVIDLAQMISAQTGTPVRMQPNPRKEAPENDLTVTNDCFMDLGLRPNRLEQSAVREVIELARKHADRVRRDKIVCDTYWTRELREAAHP